MNEPVDQQIGKSTNRAIGGRQSIVHLALLSFVLLIAFFLRTYRMSEVPSCLDIDEASNVILMGEISRGEYFPIFIRPYNGKEVLFFYLVAGMMKLAGVTPFALRLTSAFCGVINIALTYFFVQELSAYSPPATVIADRDKRCWLGLFSAALVTICYWQVNLSRFGYRTIVMPPLLALAGGFLLRALRTEKWRWTALAGALTGLSAYTYFSVRAWPILLVLLWGWVLIADRRRWWLRVRQLLLFGLIALIVFAPLGVYFLRNPEMLFVRMDQVSVFSPEVNQGDLWGTFKWTLGMAFGMFTVAGDLNAVYNLSGKPIFDHVIGLFFYLGLLICAVRMVWPSGSRVSLSRFPYFLLLAWLPIMMIPNVLSASGVPHNVRAMSLLPAVFVIPAVGIATAIEWIEKGLAKWKIGKAEIRSRGLAIFRAALLILLLIAEGGFTYHDYFDVWAGSAAPYYKGHEFLIRAAELINAHPEYDPYIATHFLQHPTVAVYAHNYPGIRWIGGKTLVLPPPTARPALLIYDYDNPVDPLLRDRYLGGSPLHGALFHRELGPDGGTAFEAFLLTADNRPLPAPQYKTPFNLGNTLAFLGYDLNAPAVSGDALDITLYFQVLRAVDRDDFAFFAHLTDDLGFRWGGETFFNYPSLQWRPGEVMLFHKQIAIEPGAPPGVYQLDVGVYSTSLDARLPVLDQAGQMAGTTFRIGPFDVAAATQPPVELPSIQQPMVVQFGSTLNLLGMDRDRGDLRPGETLALTLYWQASGAPPEDALVSLWLENEATRGQSAAARVDLWHGHPVHGTYPFAQWLPNAFIRDRYALRLPLDAPAGDFHLCLALDKADGQALEYQATAAVEGEQTAACGRSSAVSLGTLHVHATDRLWEPPAFDHPVGARLGPVELVGYTLDRDAARPGESLRLTLIWRCLEEMDISYTVFTHLLDQNEQMRGQKDNPPKNGTYPTTLWVAGEIVVDEYEIAVKPDAAPGLHVIEVGMYDPANVQRLQVVDPTGTIADRILLGQVTVEGGQ